jgi:L-aspartate oxidase
MSPAWTAEADLIVVGTGVAGLTAALAARRAGLRVIALTKAAVDVPAGGEPWAEDLGGGNTGWAQGGVAVAIPGTGDTVEAHLADTVTAGAGLCDVDVARAVLERGWDAVSRLRALGARFDQAADGSLARTREGGHRALRVVHAGGDATGAEVARALAVAAHADRLPVLTAVTALAVLRAGGPAEGPVAGLAVADRDGVPGVLAAPAVLLATGGLGHLYRTTTNPPVATGDGVALALRAGAAVADLEFVQFHPTVLVSGGTGRRPLITEAVRGEGAVLVDLAGRPVMAGVHPLGDLAPRDVVSAAITRLMAATGADHVLLDATGLPVGTMRRRFPTVTAACLAVGIDPEREPIPVAPAAHYSCGGVLASVHGRTGVPGLYAAGEVARTGLHGANRLASNSLLEGLVTGELAAEAVLRDRGSGTLLTIRAAATSAAGLDPWPRPGRAVPRAELQGAMSLHAAIGRDAAGLGELMGLLAGAGPTDCAEDAALTEVAAALVAAASARTESRGCHVRSDAPGPDPAWAHSITVTAGPSGDLTVAPLAAPALGGVA